MAQCQWPRAHMVKLFLVFTYIWQEDLAKIFKKPGPWRNVNPAPGYMFRGRNHLLYHFSITIHLSTLPVFTQQNTLKKIS